MNKIKLLALDVKHSQILGFSDQGTLVKTVLANCGGAPDGIQVDPAKGHIYWTNMGSRQQGERFDQNDGFIERCDFDGANRTVISQPGTTFTPKQLKLDLLHGHMYWCDREGMRVMRANLDGSNCITLVRTGNSEDDRQDQLRHCVGIALDLAHNYLYWSQKGPSNGGLGRIFRAGLAVTSGWNPDERTDIELLWDNLPEPIDLELNEASGELYWTDRGLPPMGNTLNRGRVRERTMSKPEVLVSGLSEAIGLAFDLSNERIFLSDLGGHLYCSRLSGREHRVIYAGDEMFTGLAYLSE